MSAIEFTGEVHPLAAMWPTVEDLDALAADIAESGLRYPIVLDTYGRLVDGRNRLAACTEAGVEPTFVVDESLTSDEDIALFIGSVNVERRNISTSQQAMGRGLMLQAAGRRRDGRWVRGAITKLGNSDTSTELNAMKKVGTVLDYEPTLAASVLAGDLALDAAYRVAVATRETVDAEALAEKRRKAQEKAEAEAQAKRIADLAESRPDLAAMVEAGDLSLGDAWTIREKDIREAQREAERDRVWRKKLRDGVVEGVLGIESAAHPNNIDAALAGFDEFHLSFEHRPLSVADLEKTKAHIDALIGRMS